MVKMVQGAAQEVVEIEQGVTEMAQWGTSKATVLIAVWRRAAGNAQTAMTHYWTAPQTPINAHCKISHIDGA